MALVLNEDWTAEVVGRMHKFRIKTADLSERCGYHRTYLSTVLNGNKEFENPESVERIRKHVLHTLEEMEAERLKEVEEN